MAVRFSDDQVTAATGGKRVRSGARVAYAAVSTDSRHVPTDALFVALKGERFDGHAFLVDAARAGAAGVVVAKGTALQSLPEELAVFEVDDTLVALGRLARFHRSRFKGKVAAIGGSNGKTTTKEMVGAIFAAHGPSLKTEGNLNNEIGVPLTLFRLEPAHQLAAIELGMNHPGEMARLTEIAQPDAALLTVIQPEHLEGLGSLRGVAEAEGELFRGLRKEAIAIVNLDDEHIVSQASASVASKITFGKHPRADVRLLSVTPQNAGPQNTGQQNTGQQNTWMSARISAFGKTHNVTLGFLGEHNAQNATGAFAVGLALGVSPDTCVKGLAAAQPHARRLRMLAGEAGVRILDDCYNANPGSMTAALETLQRAASPGRALAVLGDMLELGEAETSAHETLGQQAARVLHRVAFFGPRSKTAHAAASGMQERAAHFLEVPPLLGWLRADLQAGDVVLVKGSRGMQLERVVDALTGVSAGSGGH
ncbi:MAG: UDP-N-acetylmuramoyl-tripeptide--D-alanyl-D-alanine ligase [Myxococcaceae bacterium]